MPSLRSVPLVAAFLLLAACSGERNPGSAPGSSGAGTGAAGDPSAQAGQFGKQGGGVRIEPAVVYRGTTVRFSGIAPPDGAAKVEWLVNGLAAQGGTGQAFDTSSLRKGDSIQVRIAGPEGTVQSPPVEVRNSPPAVGSARFVFGDGPQGTGIRVETEARDADGDDVLIEIAWRKNGEPAGTGDRLDSAVKKGDKVEVTLTPFDGTERGRSATITREIRNTPPVVEGQERFQVTGNVVTFRVRASDADGDPLSFGLRESPDGMTIDRATGWVRWEAPPGSSGKVPFAVTVSDGAGGEATARFNVTIEEESRPSPR